MTKPLPDDANLTGTLLAAMPVMTDPRFARALIYVCAHSADGAMGLVVNNVSDELSFSAVIGQLGIKGKALPKGIPVHLGGPVEGGRGFVLHSPDYAHESTLAIDDDFALTATVDILHAIADGKGPRRLVFALGYAGWSPGQLDQEIQQNGWLVVPADEDLVYGVEPALKWTRALGRLGIDPSLLSSTAGHA
ncbi:MAG: YqgE/AlgH family protein [Geminicoccaceae bacterium]|nr:YqgE/AlgH family protein [Geminicoccaceae bacterium]